MDRHTKPMAFHDQDRSASTDASDDPNPAANSIAAPNNTGGFSNPPRAPQSKLLTVTAELTSLGPSGNPSESPVLTASTSPKLPSTYTPPSSSSSSTSPAPSNPSSSTNSTPSSAPTPLPPSFRLQPEDVAALGRKIGERDNAQQALAREWRRFGRGDERRKKLEREWKELEEEKRGYGEWLAEEGWSDEDVWGLMHRDGGS